ncbi:MAG: hypothetical protein FJ290_10865 [Planctomycetes bacterium]|nr:hypothetical protein [Planctomycetota bacterium]
MRPTRPASRVPRPQRPATPQFLARGTRHAARMLALCLPLLSAASALAAANLVENGGFEKSDGKLPEAWHCKLTDFMPKEVGKDEGGTMRYRYICACGQDLGDAKPWCGLLCPKCSGFISGEECGAWYVQNHERVSLDRNGPGYCVKFTLDKSTGENQGVRIMSHLIKVKPAWGYVMTFSCRTKGSIARVWAECYRPPQSTRSRYWEGPMDPAKPKDGLERSHRAQVNCGSPASWETFTKEIVAPKKYQFEFISVKLYAYMPGEAWFDNVSIRPMTPSEYSDFVATKNKTIKDKRFAY